MKGPWLVYIIQSTTSARTYVGCTNNFARRIRQHNGDLVGGAKYTRGNSWAPVVLCKGFADDQRHALQFEWRLKERKGRVKSGCSGVDRRVTSLHRLLGLDKVTAKAPPLCDTQVTLEWHSSSARSFFADLLASAPLPLEVLQTDAADDVPETGAEEPQEPALSPEEVIDLVGSSPLSSCDDNDDGNGKNDDGDSDADASPEVVLID